MKTTIPPRTPLRALLLGASLAATFLVTVPPKEGRNVLVKHTPEDGPLVAEVVLTFDGIDAVSDPTGDPTTWQVAADDLGELYLEGFKFLSNFQVELDLATQRPGCDEETAGCERAALGQHALTLQISNHYGTFTVQTTVLVFP